MQAFLQNFPSFLKLASSMCADIMAELPDKKCRAVNFKKVDKHFKWSFGLSFAIKSKGGVSSSPEGALSLSALFKDKALIFVLLILQQTRKSSMHLYIWWQNFVAKGSQNYRKSENFAKSWNQKYSRNLFTISPQFCDVRVTILWH